MGTKWVDAILTFIQYGALGALGGVAFYIYILSTRGGKFHALLFGANLFLAFFVGKIAGSFLPAFEANPDIKNGLVMAAGFCTYPILRLLEARFGKWFVDRILPGGDQS